MENLRIGTEVEFRVITVNILGRESFPSDTSPTYQVVGECSPETFVVPKIVMNSFVITRQALPPGHTQSGRCGHYRRQRAKLRQDELLSQLDSSRECSGVQTIHKAS